MVVTGYPSNTFAILRLFFTAFAILAWGCGCHRERPAPVPAPIVQNEQYLVGAHYYVWYPKNFTQGFLRGALRPAQEPLLGLYNSTDPKIAEQQIAWCSQYGIDFLTVNWWPTRAKQNNAMRSGFMKARNLGDIRFCIFYEAWALGFDNKTGATIFTEEKADRLVRDVVGLAEEFFPHPSYLRIQGRPVLLLYLTRTFAGKYREAIARTRTELRRRGMEPYLIADEIFWGAIAQTDKPDGTPWGENRPQRERIALFDAVFGYNLYDWAQKQHAGYAARSRFVPDVCGLYREYQATLPPSVALVPTLIPGYNDRGVRVKENHFAIPRQWDEGAEEGSFLAESFDRIGFPWIDPRLNMLLITSWNEWNEDSAIEPLRPTPATTRDRSNTGTLFTEGYRYEGHGFRHLEVVRTKTVAVAGRCVTEQGVPLKGIPITAWAGREQVGADTSDSLGYYTLSRLRMPPGSYRLEADHKLERAITVTREQALMQDFMLPSEKSSIPQAAP